MEDNRTEQIEALQALTEYSPKLIKGMRQAINELSVERQPDTDEYLKTVINGMNWEIQVVNGTLDCLNETEQLIDKSAANDIFVAFGEAYQKKNDSEMAKMMQDEMIPFFELVERVAKSKIN